MTIIYNDERHQKRAREISELEELIKKKSARGECVKHELGILEAKKLGLGLLNPFQITGKRKLNDKEEIFL